MESLRKAQEQLEEKRSQVIERISNALKEQPELAKAFDDLRTINRAMDIATSALEKASKETSRRDGQEEDETKKTPLEEAVTEVVAIFERDETPSDKDFSSIAKKYGVEVEELEDEVAKFLDSQRDNDEE